MIWLVWGCYKLPTLEIEADSFDEALAKARVVNPCYDSGKVKEETDKKSYLNYNSALEVRGDK